MMKCVYCGRFAGLFSRCHSACECRHSSGLVSLHDLFRMYFRGEVGSGVLAGRLPGIIAEGLLTDEDVESSAGYALRAFADSLYSPVEPVCLTRLAEFMEYVDCFDAEASRAYVALRLVEAYMEEWTGGIGPIEGVDANVYAAFRILSVDESRRKDLLQKALVGVAESLVRRGCETVDVRGRFAALCRYAGMEAHDMWRSESDALTTICKLVVIDQSGLKKPDSHDMLWCYEGVEVFVPRGEWDEKGYPALPGLRYGPERFKGRRPDYEKFDRKATGRLSVFCDRFRFESREWDFEVCFDSISGSVPYAKAVVLGSGSDIVMLDMTDAWFLMSLFNLS